MDRVPVFVTILNVSPENPGLGDAIDVERVARSHSVNFRHASERRAHPDG